MTRDVTRLNRFFQIKAAFPRFTLTKLSQRIGNSHQVEAHSRSFDVTTIRQETELRHIGPTICKLQLAITWRGVIIWRATDVARTALFSILYCLSKTVTGHSIMEQEEEEE